MLIIPVVIAGHDINKDIRSLCSDALLLDYRELCCGIGHK